MLDCLRRPYFADLNTIPIAQDRLQERRKRCALRVVERQEAHHPGRPDPLRPAAFLAVAFEREAEPLLRQRAAIDAFGAGLDENTLAEKLHDIGAKSSGAGDMPWLLRAGPAQPRRSLGAAGRQAMAGAELGKTAGEIFKRHRP